MEEKHLGLLLLRATNQLRLCYHCKLHPSFAVGYNMLRTVLYVQYSWTYCRVRPVGISLGGCSHDICRSLHLKDTTCMIWPEIYTPV